jgi:hypothetical protein
MPFLPTAERWCPACEKSFLATIYTERQGKETGPMTVTPCPDCGTTGQLLADVSPTARPR